MRRYARHNLISDLFSNGLPEDLAALLGIEQPIWLLLNLPAKFLPPPRSPDLPATVDVVGGPLTPGHQADFDEIEKRARWHFPDGEREDAWRRLTTDMALSSGLLRPSLEGLFAVQLLTSCISPDPDAIAALLLEIGFARVAVLVGEDGLDDIGQVVGATFVRSRVDDVEERLQLVLAGEPVPGRPGRTGAASKPLRDRLHRLLRSLPLPRHTPVLVDMASRYPDD